MLMDHDYIMLKIAEQKNENLLNEAYLDNYLRNERQKASERRKKMIKALILEKAGNALVSTGNRLLNIA